MSQIKSNKSNFVILTLQAGADGESRFSTWRPKDASTSAPHGAKSRFESGGAAWAGFP